MKKDLLNSDLEIENIQAEIKTLPSGGITIKTINGKNYEYYQWREDGKQHSRRVRAEELESLREHITRRKELQQRLKDYAYLTKDAGLESKFQFHCMVRIGKELDRFVKPVEKWKKRECFTRLRDYIYGDDLDKVFILFGLRRTGKTTLMRQLISEMKLTERSKTAFIQVQVTDSLADINRDLQTLEKLGYRNIFFDEVTLLEDFIEGAALFSDIFASSGMKIVLSGTDSLGFLFSEDRELYDRCIKVHTTFIPYREFENVLGLSGIDNYIEFGGTMSLSGTQYNDSIFSAKKTTDEYVDSAIAKNIQHSLKNYKYESHFRSLKELYEKNELTNVINRIVEDINHRFTMEVLNRDFKSNDLRLSANNLRKDRKNPTDILDRVDIKKINHLLKEKLDIKDCGERSVDIADSHRLEIKEYLDLLDLTVDIKTNRMTDYNRSDIRTAFSQPGLRYSQAKALVKSLMEDDAFRDLSLAQRMAVTDRILNEIKGRMMEDIVLLETICAKKKEEVFRLQFAVGEFDMVIFDPESATCEIYEIKHSKEAIPAQCRHLMDEKLCKETEFRYGKITGKYVIYRGESMQVKASSAEDVSFINVEEYLREIKPDNFAKKT